jgi:hypothetical protein
MNKKTDEKNTEDFFLFPDEKIIAFYAPGEKRPFESNLIGKGISSVIASLKAEDHPLNTIIYL